MKSWTVSLAGKWGGVRSVTVFAPTPSKAKKEAENLRRNDERIQSVYPAGRSR